MAYKDENGKITIDDVAAGEDIRKISKFLNKKKELVYYYCDIIETAYLKAENAYIFTDLLADVIIHPDGAVLFGLIIIFVTFLAV